MSKIALAVLGPFALQCATGAPVRLGRKTQALLACIAGHGAEGAARPALLSLLWPDQPEQDARAALRQCLHQLRRAVPGDGEWIASEGEQVVFDPSRCEVDLWRFEQGVGSADPQALTTAASLWRGDFAQGLELPGDEGVWLALRRDRCRDGGHSVLQALAALPHTQDSFDAALALSRHLLAADPLHEGAYRAQMRLYLQAGLRGKAIEVFEHCRRQLREQLAVSPSPLTLHVAAALSGAPRSGGPAGAGPAFDHLLAGWHYFSHFSPRANARARAEYRAALRLAPRLPDGLAMLGWTHWIDAINGWTEDPAGAEREAGECAGAALQQQPLLPSALGLRGRVRLWRHQHEAALADQQQALVLAPNSAYAYFHLADALAWSGRPQEALGHIARALEMNPNDHGVFLQLEGFARFLLHDLAGARAVLERARIRNPGYSWTFSTLGSVLHEVGEHAAAREAAARARNLNPRLSVDFSRRVVPMRDPAHRARLVAACEANGLPAVA